MPFDSSLPKKRCTVCGSDANILYENFGVGEVVNCSRCGDYRISHVTAEDEGLPLHDPKKVALGSYLIRRMQGGSSRPLLRSEFFRTLSRRRLPTPAEASDNLIIELAEKAEFRPGPSFQIVYSDSELLGKMGVVDSSDVGWIIGSLIERHLISGESFPADGWFDGNLTAAGWVRFEELQRAHIASKYAFFARKFDNPELDQVVELCLQRAIEQTGFELRIATQKAGLVDAIIEDEIRRCRFLVSDLSDDNAGAYWEAGFAEGLGKPVIYICREKTKDGGDEKKTHFDTNHRHTVRWSLDSLDMFATNVKAVIRNTLLGEAEQDD